MSIELLKRAWDLITWMSGSDDFGPNGKAHQGWLKSEADRQAIAAAISEAND